jgi:hypothetical protein
MLPGADPALNQRGNNRLILFTERLVHGLLWTVWLRSSLLPALASDQEGAHCIIIRPAEDGRNMWRVRPDPCLQFRINYNYTEQTSDGILRIQISHNDK